MSNFQLSSLRNSSVWGLYRIKDRIEMDPLYQREGDIWTLEKRQLLIDTIINQFDVPKIYLHKFPQPVEQGGRTLEFAVIDGKQRLNAICDFIDGKFSLASDFEYLRSDESGSSINAHDLTYADLARKYPEIKTDFDSYALDIVCIETGDLELIEELFSRLNEAVPLNAPEKRNALPGSLPKAVRELTRHTFFSSKLPFSNKRYRHYDLAAKMLLIISTGDVTDTKKVYLDRFFKNGVSLSDDRVSGYSDGIISILDAMANVFLNSDPLLRQIGMTVLYFYLFHRAAEKNLTQIIHREAFLDFEKRRKANRELAERDIAQADYNLLEFDRFSQSPNDAFAMRFRLTIIDELAFEKQLGFTEFPSVESLMAGLERL